MRDYLRRISHDRRTAGHFMFSQRRGTNAGLKNLLMILVDKIASQVSTARSCQSPRRSPRTWLLCRRFYQMKWTKFSEFAMHEQKDLVDFWKIRCNVHDSWLLKPISGSFYPRCRLGGGLEFDREMRQRRLKPPRQQKYYQLEQMNGPSRLFFEHLGFWIV